MGKDSLLESTSKKKATAKADKEKPAKKAAAKKTTSKKTAAKAKKTAAKKAAGPAKKTAAKKSHGTESDGSQGPEAGQESPCPTKTGGKKTDPQRTAVEKIRAPVSGGTLYPRGQKPAASRGRPPVLFQRHEQERRQEGPGGPETQIRLG